MNRTGTRYRTARPVRAAGARGLRRVLGVPAVQLGRAELLRLRRPTAAGLRRASSNYVYLFTNPYHERAVLERARQQRRVLPHPPARRGAGRPAHGGAADLRHAAPVDAASTARCCSSPRRSRSSSSASSGGSSSARCGARRVPAARRRDHRPADDLADVRVAVRRHPDDLPVHGAASRSPTTSSRPPGSTAPAAGRTFWRIKFPLIAPQFGLIAILTYIWTFNGFDIVYALNGSAPGPELLHRHPGHAVLPHVLRLERPGRRPRPRRDGRHR